MMPRRPYTTTVTSDDALEWDAYPVCELPDGGMRMVVWVEGWDVSMDFDANGECGDFRCEVDDLRRMLATEQGTSCSDPLDTAT